MSSTPQAAGGTVPICKARSAYHRRDRLHAARRLAAFLNLKPGETRALAWAWLYVFALFLAYYVLRPIRDELGVAGGVQNLPWLFAGTLLAMLGANPLFALTMRRWPRERFIAVVYRFFAANLVVFAALLPLSSPAVHVWIGRVFFIWISVFNLFVVSVFWSCVVDIFNAEQGKRLFGLLAAGATVGGIAGSSLTSVLAQGCGQSGLLAIAIALLEVAVIASRRLAATGWALRHAGEGSRANEPIGGGMLAGMSHTFRSPYLTGIALFVFLYTITSTVLYFQQAGVASREFATSATRTAFFANIDFWVNSLSLVFQLFLAGRLMGWLGVAATLCILPLVSAVGFVALAMAPAVPVFVAVQVARRVADYSLARPPREVLFTSVQPEDRYKAKNFIDTVIYRGGDQIGGWAYAGLTGLGLSATGVVIAAVPLSAVWLVLAVWLGRRHAALSATGISRSFCIVPVATPDISRDSATH